MIDKILALGLTALGATMMTKKGNLFIDNDDFLVDGFSAKIDNVLFDFIKEYEGFRANAYNLGDGKFTIGYGNTIWLKSNGQLERPVRMGDKITEPQARVLMERFYITMKPALDNILRSKELKISNRAYQMILRFLYGTGFWVLGKNEFQNMLIRLDGNLDSEYISDLMKSEFIRVLKTVKYNKPCDKKGNYFGYACYGLGWSRWVYALTMYVKGTFVSKSQADILIKNAY